MSSSTSWSTMRLEVDDDGLVIVTLSERNLRALLASGSALVSVPVFLAVILIVRGVPAMVYRAEVGTRNVIVAGLLQATTLPFIVAGVRIGIDLGKMSQETGAALIAAGMLSLLIFPVTAMTLLKGKEAR